MYLSNRFSEIKNKTSYKKSRTHLLNWETKKNCFPYNFNAYHKKKVYIYYVISEKERKKLYVLYKNLINTVIRQQEFVTKCEEKETNAFLISHPSSYTGGNALYFLYYD